MKKSLILFMVFLVFTILLSFTTLAHSGGTDSQGGHYAHSDGSYHYHHGHPAHDHPNGECPYLKEENKSEKNDFNFFESLFVSIIIGGWFGGVLLLAVLFWPLKLLLRDFFENHLAMFQLGFSIVSAVLLFVFIYNLS